MYLLVNPLPFLTIIFTFQQRLSGGKVLNQGSDSNGGNFRQFGGLLWEGIWKKVKAGLSFHSANSCCTAPTLRALIQTPTWNPLKSKTQFLAVRGFMIKDTQTAGKQGALSSAL